MARKRFKWVEGSIFLVPQADGGCSVGQVLRHVPEALNSVICSFYDLRTTPGSAVSAEQLTESRLISIQFVTPDLLKSGRWEVVGQGAPQFLDRMTSLPSLEAANFVGAGIEGSGIMVHFLDAFYGLKPWDDFKDPTYFDKLLLPLVKRPSAAVLKKDRILTPPARPS